MLAGAWHGWEAVAFRAAGRCAVLFPELITARHHAYDVKSERLWFIKKNEIHYYSTFILTIWYQPDLIWLAQNPSEEQEWQRLRLKKGTRLQLNHTAAALTASDTFQSTLRMQFSWYLSQLQLQPTLFGVNHPEFEPQFKLWIVHFRWPLASTRKLKRRTIRTQKEDNHSGVCCVLWVQVGKDVLLVEQHRAVHTRLGNV